MKQLFLLICYLLLSSQCSKGTIGSQSSRLINPKGYKSDYFVFIADDRAAPLVIPIDVNWIPHANGYTVELKSWYGTSQDWPIEYVQGSIVSHPSEIPEESFEHIDREPFYFDRDERSITTRIKGAPQVTIAVPNEAHWINNGYGEDFPTYAFRSTIQVDGGTRSGWMIYERIRSEDFADFPGFEAFYWMPIVIDHQLYQFIDHRGEQTAVRWTERDGIVHVDALEQFGFKVVETVSDDKSGRQQIPQQVSIRVPEWDIDLIMRSSGSQVGYGDSFPKGLAYFRQSLIVTAQDSKSVGYGMMELILANN